MHKKIEICLLVLIQALVFSSCVNAQYRHLSYIELPETPPIQAVTHDQKLSGKLVVEQFRDYRSVDDRTVPRWDNCQDAVFRILYLPVNKVECKHERIGSFKMRDNPEADESIVDGIPLAMVEDFEKRRLFDNIEFVKVPKEEYLEASWRLVGLIIKADETFIYNGYYLPLVNSYLFALGTPIARVAYEIEIEFKLENLKNKKALLQKKYRRFEISKGFNRYQIDRGFHGWNVGAYQFSKTIRLLVDEFVQDVLAVSKGSNT